MIAYLIAMLTQAGIYALLTLSLNLQWGYTGLLNFGVVGFFAVGAYTYALTTTVLGWPILAGGAIAIGLTALIAFPIGLASIRLRVGFYLAIVTLGFSEVIRSIIINEDWLTRGTRGVPVTRLFPEMSPLANQVTLLCIVLAAVIAVFLIFERLGRSPFGRVVEAIRDNEDAARSLGKSVSGFKIRIFMVGAAVSGGAGALNAIYTNYLVPEQFLSIITFNVWIAMIIGGSGANRGSVFGCVLLVFFLEGSRFVKDYLPAGLMDDSQLAALRLMMVGLALVLIPMYWPRGIWGRKEL